MPASKATKVLYQVPVLAKALDLLELLQDDHQPKTLEEQHRHTRIPKTTVYGMLKTFVHRGDLSQSLDGKYRQASRGKKILFGFAGQSADIALSNAVAGIPLIAVDALRERRREKHAVIVGQDCIAQAVEAMRRSGTPLIGSVSHETGTYGPGLMDLGMSLLRGYTVAPYNYVNHRMVTRESVQAALQLH